MNQGNGEVASIGPAPVPAWEPSFPRLRRIDAHWARVERVVCGVLFMAMALLVFVAVVTETFGVRREPLDAVVLFGVVLLAVRTRAVRDGERRAGWPRALALAVAFTAAIGGGVYLYTQRMPGGLPQAQPLGLALMLWVALLGASIAAYERMHLALEFGEQLWPRGARRYVKALAHTVTATFCGIACVLSFEMARSAEGHVQVNEWLPDRVVLAIVPYMFGAMAIRFLAQAVTTATGTQAPAEERMPT